MFKVFNKRINQVQAVSSINFDDNGDILSVEVPDKEVYSYYLRPGEFHLMQESGYRDLCGNKIYTGHVVEFYERDDCIWRGLIVFEDGVFTVDTYLVKQVRNPTKWDQKHDWIRSRHWSTTVGYGEYGTWNCPRNSLSSLGNVLFNNYETELKPLYEKHGFLSGRILNVRIVDLIYRSPKLLEGYE